ncbi:MAG: mechanosensitive ion channel [Bacteroidetes bacterium]|nr:mechanosensitive ion channel [Bacteroidota bacterium]
MKEFLHRDIISSGSFSVTFGSLLSALGIFIVTYILVKSASYLVRRSFRRKGTIDGRQASITQLIRYFVWILAIIFMLQVMGIDITFLIASSAALLVGVGLGLQNIFKDFISGIVLLLEGTVKAGDIVEADGMIVMVNEISLRTSRVTTRDDNVIIFPNHKFVEEKIVNWTNNLHPTRFSISVGVDYSSDAALVSRVMMACGLDHADILKDEKYYPFVRLESFDDSALTFALIFYSNNLFRIENVKSQLRLALLEAFRKNNITIPFPQRVIHGASAQPVPGDAQ